MRKCSIKEVAHIQSLWWSKFNRSFSWAKARQLHTVTRLYASTNSLFLTSTILKTGSDLLYFVISGWYLCTPCTSYRYLSVGKFRSVYCVKRCKSPISVIAFDQVMSRVCVVPFNNLSIAATTNDQLDAFDDINEMIDQNLPSQALGWIIQQEDSPW